MVISPGDNETSVGRLIQYKAIQEVVELAFLCFFTFAMLSKYTCFPWKVGWVNERCVRRMEVDTERERWREAEREKVENGSTCFSDSIDFAIRSWDEDSCVCNCHKSWTRYATHCRYITCCLNLAKMKKDKIIWKEAEVWWKWQVEKNEITMLSIPLSETRFSLLFHRSHTRRDWCLSSNQRPVGVVNRARFDHERGTMPVCTSVKKTRERVKHEEWDNEGDEREERDREWEEPGRSELTRRRRREWLPFVSDAPTLV